jgi:hypothetical protein
VVSPGLLFDLRRSLFHFIWQESLDAGGHGPLRAAPIAPWNLQRVSPSHSAWNFALRPALACRQKSQEDDMGRGLLLWLIGIPLPIILIVWLLGGLHG